MRANAKGLRGEGACRGGGSSRYQRLIPRLELFLMMRALSLMAQWRPSHPDAVAGREGRNAG